MMTRLYTVIPCYNEEAVLEMTAAKLLEKYQTLIKSETITQDSRIVFVNDGSKDATWQIIRRLHEETPVFSGINLSCNRGHQNALLAGLMTVKKLADAVISMDADLQDDINAIDEMLAQFAAGNDVVYAVRSSRATDNVFKRGTAQGFYKMMEYLGAKTIYNHADYRLMSRRALEGLEQFEEVNLFLRGLVPMIGYPSAVVYYERSERAAGESKYTLGKMLSFAFEGITSLSTKPIQLITLLGGAVFTVSLCILLYIFIRHITGNTVTGWASLAASVWALGGLQLLAIGVVGQYVGKVYIETKKRPRYLVAEFLHDAATDEGAR